MFPKELYINRREQLRKKLQSGIVLLPGNLESPMNYPSNGYHFRQDSNFLYFFGVDLPGIAGILDIDEGKDILFGNDTDIEDIIWMGPQKSMKEFGTDSGASRVEPYSGLATYIGSAIAKGRTIQYLPPYRPENKMIMGKLLGIYPDRIRDYSSVQLIRAIISLREIKDRYEIEDIEKCEDVAYEMHTTAMKMARPGILESEISGVIEGIALKYGGMISFPVICSIRGEILHNHNHGNLLKEGDLLITDAGAESSLHYASDITRTFPVTGKFTQKQKDIYQIVLDANNTVTASSKPGMTYQSVHLQAARVIAGGLKDLGLMKGDIDEAVAAGAHAMFFPHGLGHMMGLDVHDMEDMGEDYVGYDSEISRIDQFGTAYLRLGKRLKPGFVITNEPGIYFIPELISQWKNDNKFSQFINYPAVEQYLGFGGIRLEDDILITESGCRILGKKRVPVTINEIENIVGNI
ncbi:MAG: aminopeptidase P family protein [Bacteroidia bacterium]|nr:aminopeptidase P family protein [Bacteroidia bacterium]